MKFHTDSLSVIDSHPLLWRGTQVSHTLETRSTGYTSLDKVLPGGGWPTGAATELISDTTGFGELSLLLPVLAQLSQEGCWITMVDPPWIPCPSALHSHGLALKNLFMVRTQDRHESLWACEQVVRGLSGGAMLAWPDNLSFAELRRLQLAAESTLKTVFLFRHQSAANTSSPVALRLQLRPDDGDLQIRVLKCRGQRPAQDIRIHRSQLSQDYQLPEFPAVPACKVLTTENRLRSEKAPVTGHLHSRQWYHDSISKRAK